jgi:hypothetical protein
MQAFQYPPPAYRVATMTPARFRELLAAGGHVDAQRTVNQPFKYHLVEAGGRRYSEPLPESWVVELVEARLLAVASHDRTYDHVVFRAAAAGRPT